ncbi:MAG: Na+/H+ antiporter subunit E [Andreesenia angusta]|nr:Na+/H+ antiporter subunit E [Andreesenia angusta]
MKRHNFIMILSIFIFLTWCILNESFSIEYMFAGLVTSLIILMVAERYISDSTMPNISFKYILNFIKYIGIVIFLVYKSAFQIIGAILRREFIVNIVKVDLPTKQDFINSLVCSSITLAPGTITIEKDGRQATVLTLNTQNKTKEELKKEIEDSFKCLKKEEVE